jgi:hypothetical protein
LVLRAHHIAVFLSPTSHAAAFAPGLRQQQLAEPNDLLQTGQSGLLLPGAHSSACPGWCTKRIEINRVCTYDMLMLALLLLLLLSARQGRASNDLLSQDDLSFYFEDHTAGLAKAAAAAMATALNGAMDQHLKPLLPEGHSAAVAASGGAAAAALSRQLPQPLQKYAAADELLSGTLDDRWIRYTEQQRLDAWRAWIDEHVWGKVPVPPPSVNPAAAGAAAAAGPCW